MGLEDALILLYLLIDDAYRVVTFGSQLRQRGPESKLSDVEVLTMEVFGERQGRHDDAAIHRYVDGHWRHFFPNLGSYQTSLGSARRCRWSNSGSWTTSFRPAATFTVSMASLFRSVATAVATGAGPSRTRRRGATARPRRSISLACAATCSGFGVSLAGRFGRAGCWRRETVREDRMVRPYSADLRERVLAAWEQGEGTAAELAQRFRVSKATVNNWRRALRTEGRRHAKPLGHGPAPRLDAAARETLQRLVEANNDATLAEYRTQLGEQTGIWVSAAVLCLTLQRLKLSRKKRPCGPRNGSARMWRRSDTSIVPRWPAWIPPSLSSSTSLESTPS
jgi:transposase